MGSVAYAPFGLWGSVHRAHTATKLYSSSWQLLSVVVHSRHRKPGFASHLKEHGIFSYADLEFLWLRQSGGRQRLPHDV